MAVCPASLEVGQVWELMNDGELSPGLLLSYEEPKSSVGGGRYWRVLDLSSGEVYAATVNRWNGPFFDLVGRRLL